MAIERATIGGGCFWCLEAVFQRLRGVNSVVSGYGGGKSDSPTYEEVCSGLTGHAEVVQIEFDNEITSFHEILEVFFTIHDPTTPNRQGNDVGPQYRSIILYHNDEQKSTAAQVITEVAAKLYDDPVVTEVEPLIKFYSAEKLHQNYFNDNSMQPYCMFVVAPKVQKFKKKFKDKLVSA